MTGKNDNCLRCNNGLTDSSKDLCKLCGWDFHHVTTLSAADLEQAVAVTMELNTRRLNNDLALDKRSQEYKQLGEATTRLSESCEDIEKEIARMKELIGLTGQKLESNRQQKEALEMQTEVLKKEVSEMNRYNRSADSLYKNTGDPDHSRSLKLRTEGSALTTLVKAGVDFPADLVAALALSKASAAENIKNAEYYKVIKKTDWKQEEGNKWRCELGALLRGKIASGVYTIHCTHVDPEAYNYRLEDVATKIVIP